MKRIFNSDYHDHVVRQDGRVEKLKDAVLRCFRRGDKARQARGSVAPLASRLAENPPVALVGLAPVLIALWFHRLEEMVVHFGEAVTNLALGQAIEVNYHGAAGTLKQVAAV